MSAWSVPVAEPSLTSREQQWLAKVLPAGRITQGKFVEEFERRVAKACRVPYAVAMSSGTAAVHAALMALGIKAGDEVITTPLSCIASSNPILFQGAKPVFIDIDPQTYNMNLDLIESAITRKTKAIVAVHLFGRPLDMTRLMKIARKHRLTVIEDACQAFGGSHRGRPVGSFGDIGCFSFYANKIITTAEGGMAITRSKTLERKLRGIRNLGQDTQHFVHPWVGGNFKMSNLHASLGIAQMERLEAFVRGRRAHASAFDRSLRALSGISQLPYETKGDRHVYFSYHIELTSPALQRRVLKAFERARIETRPFFSVIPDQRSYKNLGYNSRSVPKAMNAYNKGLYFSCSPSMTEAQRKKIIQTLKKVLHGHS